MKIEYTDTNTGELLITLEGEMDAWGCSSIRGYLDDVITTGSDQNVILNFNHVSFLDSSGIGVIVFLYKRLKATGRNLKISNVQGQPQELMTLLRIDTAIPVSSLADSLTSSSA
ncbi:MAG: STAS domain-containing protein [Cycloclasticus sp.]